MCAIDSFSLRFGRSIWHRHHSLKVYWFETQAGIMSTFRNCSACVCMLSHWTSVAESSWDVDRAVRACIETTRSIALVGNSSVACQEATHQLKLWQTLAWPLTMFINFPIGMPVWNPQQNTTYKLAVAPSLAFTDCAPTEGLTMACHGMSRHVPSALCKSPQQTSL